MMRKMLRVWLSLFLIGTMLAGCAQVTEQLDAVFPENSEQTEATEDPDLIPMPERERLTYTVLLSLRAQSAEQITTLSLLTFDTQQKSVHWLMIPANLFVHVEKTTLSGVFATTYGAEIAKEGVSDQEATYVAMAELEMLLETGFRIPIDYFVSLDPEQFADFVNKTLEGIPLTLSDALGGIGAGNAKLNGKDACNFLNYKGYSDSSAEKMDVRRIFAAALWKRAAEVITNDNLTLYVAQLRGKMTTNIPLNGGEDIFFWRRFLQADPTAMAITQVSAQGIYYNSTSCQVLNRANTFRQLNEQMGIYQEALLEEQFDPEALFADYTNPLVRTVYLSTLPLPKLYTMAELDPNYQPPEAATEPSEAEAEAEA